MFEAFFLLGLTILVGYAALLIADKYRVSQVLILMLFGFIVGPLLGLVDSTEGSIIRTIYPFMATLALIVLLFDGGLSFNIFNIFKSITRSTAFTILVFLLSMAFSLLLVFYAGFDTMAALFMGAVLGGTSSAIVIAMAEKTHASDETKSLLTLESMLTDSLVIIVVFVLIQVAKAATLSAGVIANSLLSSFAISLVVGTIAAFAWNEALQRFISKYELDYMLTVAALFILYAATEAVNANGGFAVFVFGLVFGNLKKIKSPFFPFYKFGPDARIRDFQIEVTFFTRTFFFVYIGILFPLAKITLWPLVISVLLTALLVLARYISSKLLLDRKKYDTGLVVAMLPRGLAAAVVVGLLMSNGIVVPYLEETVFTVIFLTNLIATVAVYLHSNGRKDEGLEIEGGETPGEEPPPAESAEWKPEIEADETTGGAGEDEKEEESEDVPAQKPRKAKRDRAE